MKKRDDFSAKTVRILQSRVACRCSNPECRQPTSGPAMDEDGSINVGVAAHITAAAVGGPRYDATLTPDERKSGANGIWLCQICAKWIDSDVTRFTTAVLRGWKTTAIEKAFAEIATSGSDVRAPRPRFDADESDIEFLNHLALPAEDTIDSVFARAIEAATKDISAFRGVREWPPYAVALNLTSRDKTGSAPIDLEGLTKAIGVVDGLILISPPGTGKSTTLVQLAGRIAASGVHVPFLVPLGEWSDRTEDFFDFINRRNAYGAFRRGHFRQLAYAGRTVLILDGWNELNPESRTRAIRDLRALQRDYPELSVVIGTRRQSVPMEGTIVEIELLTADQQLEIARAQRGLEGEALVDRAWRTPGVRELVAVPLYLNALLAIPAASPFPQTKEEMLRMFVARHEQVPETAAILRNELHGFHTEFLTGLAVTANRTANTSILEVRARQTISAVAQRLSADGQLMNLPQPTTALDVLVGTHILVRPSVVGAVMFQHQQFQEWYASYEVEKLMIAAEQSDVDSLRTLREQILDLPAWEESILFACERLSRNDGAAIVARAVDEAIGIDPMLAAEMIYRSTTDVWDRVKSQTLALIGWWHTPGKVDRAVRFMITTGRLEFADQIWSLISSADNQIYLSALRAAERFRPSVLGKDANSKLATLDDSIRKHIIGEIASYSGYDGIELAVGLAKADPNPEVVVDVIKSLQFRRATKHITEILKTSPDSVWSELAREDYPEHLDDPILEQRLIKFRKQVAPAITDPLQRLGALTHGRHPQDSDQETIVEIISSAEFPIDDNHAWHALSRTYDLFPRAVENGLSARIEKGLEVPYQSDKYLHHSATVEHGALVQIALSNNAHRHARTAALSMVGPKVVGDLLDKLLALHDKYSSNNWQMDTEARNSYHDLNDAIHATRFASFLEALAPRAATDNPRRIALMADLVLRHGRPLNAERFSLTEDSRETLTVIVHHWIDTLLGSSQATRHEMSEVAWALQRFGGPEFVPKLKKMLDRDLADWSRAREARRLAPTRGLSPDATHSYVMQYQNTFIAIGDDTLMPLMKSYLSNLEFGIEAARVLVVTWRNTHRPNEEIKSIGWNNFGEAAKNRAARLSSCNPPPTTSEAEAIFVVVDDLLNAAQSDDERRHAIGLAQVGLSVPHGSKRDRIDALMRLPLPSSSKQGLMTAAATAGETLSADTLLSSLRELLEAATNNPWRLEESRGELMGWMVLFAFSDRPRALIEAIALLPDQYRDPWDLRRVLETISTSPHPDILNVLDDLARRDSRFTQEHEWSNAILKLGTEEAAFFLLDHVSKSALPGKNVGDRWRMVKHLAGFAQKYPTFRRELAQRYALSTAGTVRDLIEAALAEAPDEATVLSIVAMHTQEGQAFRQSNLQTALRGLAVGRRPADDWPGAFQEFSVSLAGLRKNLFHLTTMENQRATLARASLNYIERLRDKYGRINDEPRHPDIRAGGQWP